MGNIGKRRRHIEVLPSEEAAPAPAHAPERTPEQPPARQPERTPEPSRP